MCFLPVLGPNCRWSGVKFWPCPSAWPSTSRPPSIFYCPGLTLFSFTLSTAGTFLPLSGSPGIPPVCSGHALPRKTFAMLAVSIPHGLPQRALLCCPEMRSSPLPLPGLPSSLPCHVLILRTCHCPSTTVWTPRIHCPFPPLHHELCAQGPCSFCIPCT